jgi:hypothetical protein
MLCPSRLAGSRQRLGRGVGAKARKAKVTRPNRVGCAGKVVRLMCRDCGGAISSPAWARYGSFSPQGFPAQMNAAARTHSGIPAFRNAPAIRALCPRTACPGEIVALPECHGFPPGKLGQLVIGNNACSARWDSLFQSDRSPCFSLLSI